MEDYMKQFDVNHIDVGLRRPRRNRRTAGIRSLVRENVVTVNDLVMPLFIVPGTAVCIEIPSMPGIFKRSLDLTVKECIELRALGIHAVVLFPSLPDTVKDSVATESFNPDGLYIRTIKSIKSAVPDLVIITDVAMDPYSSDGHDGFVNSATGSIVNDDTLPVLARMAIEQAKAGADIIAPSDMMDGRVAHIRRALDANDFKDVGILSYTAKYASAFYGPFRDALDSAPRGGDKKTYQMDPANVREAVREVNLDIAEGADMVMVKPGMPYLDVVRAIRDASNLPVAVYNVSGEYAMLNAASINGWLCYRSVVEETLLSFKRAGADLIFTYHAKEFAQWQKEGN